MGIRGLSTFIQKRSEKCLSHHNLQNTSIVIDGNNFLHFLFQTCGNQNACFGGDYTIFDEFVRNVFGYFKKCKIHAIIVFDGGMDVGGRKQKTRLLRAKQKLVASTKVKPSNQDRMSVLPLLTKVVFLSVLKDFSIEVIHCQYEADCDIAALARGLKCPVASNDSDFFVMDVLVIPLTFMELRYTVVYNEGFAIECKIFSMDSFLLSIGHTDASIFPLMGTLLGNDYADKRLFRDIFSRIHLPKNKSLNEQQRKIQGLLEWLKGQTVDEAIERILPFIKSIYHNQVKAAIRTSLKAYAMENNGKINSISDLRGQIVTRLIEDGLPEWFAKRYVDSDIPSWVLEIILCHKIPYQSQVESRHLTNSFSCCVDILKAIALICWDSQENNELVTLVRNRSILTHISHKFLKSDFPVSLPGLSAIHSMKLRTKQQLLFDIVLGQESGRIQSLPEKLKLFFAAVVHWVRHSSCAIRSYHVDGLILGLIELFMIEPRIGRVRSVKRLENLKSKMQTEDQANDFFHAAIKTFNLREIDPKMASHDINYDRDIVHVLGELQATFYYAHTLNNVLDCELRCPSPSTFFWGTFIYNAVCLFQNHDRLKLAENIFGSKTSPLYQSFKEYTDIIYELAPSSLMAWTPLRPYQPRKKRSRKRGGKKKQLNSTPTSDELSSDEEDDIELVGNRFSLLGIS